MFGRERWCGGVVVLLVGRRVGVAPAEVRAVGPPIAAREPDGAREIVGMEVENRVEGRRSEVGAWVVVVKKPARFKGESSVGKRVMGGMDDWVGCMWRWVRNFSGGWVISSELAFAWRIKTYLGGHRPRYLSA